MDRLGWKTLVENAPTEAEILVVEDDPILLELTSSAIEDMGFSVRSAASAEEAD